MRVEELSLLKEGTAEKNEQNDTLKPTFALSHATNLGLITKYRDDEIIF